MKKVIFIDRGNILRSPMAKAIYNSLKTDDSTAFAFGTNVTQQGTEGLVLRDYPAISGTISVLQKHGMDISDEHCRQLIPENLNDASKIIIMTEKEDIPHWLHEYPYDYWEVPNPKIVTIEAAENIFTLLKEKISQLVIK